MEEKVSNISKEIEKQISNFEKLQELMKKQVEMQEKLDVKIERWTYLNDLADKIANQ